MVDIYKRERNQQYTPTKIPQMERYEFLDCDFPKLTTMVENRPAPKHITVKCQNTVLQTEHMCSHVHTHIIFKDQESERRMASYSAKVTLKKYKTVEWCLISSLEFYQPNEPKYLSKYEHWIYTIAGMHNLKKKNYHMEHFLTKPLENAVQKNVRHTIQETRGGKGSPWYGYEGRLKLCTEGYIAGSPERSTSEGFGYTSLRNKSYWMIHWIDLGENRLGESLGWISNSN